MTDEDRIVSDEKRVTTFMKRVHEWSNSQTRIEAERDLQKTMSEDIQSIGIDPKDFVRFAKAWHKDQVSKVKDELDRSLDLFELIAGRQDKISLEIKCLT